MDLEFHELEFFEWNSSSKKKKSKSKFAITQLSKNRVLHLKLDSLKIEFQNKGIFLNSFRHETFCWKVCEKGIKPYFGLTWLNNLWSKFLASRAFGAIILVMSLQQTFGFPFGKNTITHIVNSVFKIFLIIVYEINSVVVVFLFIIYF